MAKYEIRNGEGIIPEGTTKIGRFAFIGCTSLTNITIPDSVTEIGRYAFRGCTGLTDITIPDSVTWIGDHVFYGCTGLKSIKVGEGNQRYDSRNNCNAIIDSESDELIVGCMATIIPDSVTQIRFDAFSGCTGLTDITIPDSVAECGRAFCGCTGLKSIKVGEGNQKYDSRNNCNAIIDSESNELITGCMATTIPNSVTKIGDNAFSGCTDLTDITIPDSVTEIGYFAFYGCTGLKSIKVGEGNQRYDSRNNCNAIIDSESDELIVGCMATTIPDSVTEIGDNAFCGCTDLTDITIPDSVTKIGMDAFSGCTGLTDITIPNSVTKIRECAFEGCTGLTEINIPDSVSYIAHCAFGGCTGLTNVTIPDSVTEIGRGAFSGCTGLTNVTIPDSVFWINDNAFSDCTGLTNITIPDSVIECGGAFDGCTGLKSIKVGEGNKRYDSRNNCNAIIDSESDELIVGCMATTIPDSVTKIGDLAFRGCTGLTDITIPDSVTTIGKMAFYGCTGLKSISIPESLKDLDWTDRGSLRLKVVIRPTTLADIGNDIKTGLLNNAQD